MKQLGDMALLRVIKCRMCLLICIPLTIMMMMIYMTQLVRPSQYISSLSRTGLLRTTATSSINKVPSIPSKTDTQITLFVRMAGKLLDHRARYYCDLFRTTVLYWPPSFGKTVMVLDEESEQDHVFAEKVTNQTKTYFPDHKLEVLYESLPKDKTTLDFVRKRKGPGYSRQLWSSFFIDLYSNDSIIAWMDNDAAFITPVTKSSIFTGTKIRVIGTECTFDYSWVQKWARSTELALGLPYVADFMIYFPVYIYRDTFTHCREYILKRFNTNNFGKAFKKLNKRPHSPVSIILSYAWYFERDRYDWNFKICTELTEYNKRFPNGHAIGPEYVNDFLYEPQTAFHVTYSKVLLKNILVSYCLSHEAAGNKLNLCSNHSVSLSKNLVLFTHDLQRVKNRKQTPCTGNNAKSCLQVLKRHYNQVGLEIKQHERKMKWTNLETVEKLANEFEIKCPPLL